MTCADSPLDSAAKTSAPAPETAAQGATAETSGQSLDLTRFTAARVAVGLTGVSLPTAAHLAFLADHAMARDAVHLPVDVPGLLQELAEAGLPSLSLRSRAGDRREYLLRPDLGRRLDNDSAAMVARAAHEGALAGSNRPDLALVVADGLSAPAVMRQAVPFLREFLPRCRSRGYRLAMGTYVRFGRVAVADEVGELCRARTTVILIGERPGLTSPDSLGVYLTFGPKVGNTDERRNCISNVRPEGLPHAEAAATLDHLLHLALTRELTGVMLKDDRPLAVGNAAASVPGVAAGKGERRGDGVS
ncbi:ethanolamine ammonia-lyase subunit EutC [Desulfovibrio sulfodismutans]|uniref:Ethanolamine ammonia-lyase small subunit n=1 Tax=Desulfolutivibrio sulfodismutans TaxID=63561 RepID=A0A7K3NP42_9BACT|nr:ethanolamine ammonia-lyase subunit EutC [Desulfolutivibrio sulfodismutans]NDY57565.1 ethanolamine ammonia-lyase subunit EutC [Desulfolutivibrio sulfodismutans]QLA14289.1 ethanolamine ammonia-lyase subunit EutC [Desulfolutivibrio sulfodismutans DSM 3696]